MKVKFETPVIGQAPMDGVSDAAFRYVTDHTGHPGLLFTEFVSVEGVTAGAVQLLQAFVHHPTDTPTIAQIYGVEPEAFYQAALIAASLGFDGIDINMGCPDKSVTGRGAGAGLIAQPQLAIKIIQSVRKALVDHDAGVKLESTGLRQKVINAVKLLQDRLQIAPKKNLSLSVKTRIGIEDVETDTWLKTLVQSKPDWITVHGRTLKQMYTGRADWSEIAKAALIAHAGGVKLIGNGDVRSLAEARARISEYHLDGVLIGRAACGNPWIFRETIPTTRERLKVALLHCHAFAKLLPDGNYLSLRKHLAWYCKEFHGSAEIRNRLMYIKSYADVAAILNPLLADKKTLE